MELEIKINEDGWRNLSAEEIGNTLNERISNLAAKETVIRFKDENGTVIIASGRWVQYYRDAGFVTIDLERLAKLLDVPPMALEAMKIMRGEFVNVRTD